MLILIGSKSFLKNDYLCRALICSDNPIFKLRNSAFKGFMKKCTGHRITNESTLQKNCVGEIYEKSLSKIKKIIEAGPIWVRMDETTDADGR